MEQSLNNQNNSKLFNFESLINQLKIKISNKVKKMEKQKKTLEHSSKVNDNIYNILSKSNNISLIFTIGLIASLIGITGLSFVASYNVVNSAKSITAVNKFVSLIYFFLGGTGVIATYVSLQKNEKIFDAIYSFYNTRILQPIENQLTSALYKKAEKLDKIEQDIEQLKTTLNNLDTIKDNFGYLIDDVKKDKLFTQKEVNLIYKKLSSNNIATLIYWLYNDRISDIKKATIQEMEQNAINLEEKINEQKISAQTIQDKNSETNKQSNTYHRQRRMERLHNAFYTESSSETYSDVPSTSQKTRK